MYNIFIIVWFIIFDKKYVVYIQMQYPDPVKFDN